MPTRTHFVFLMHPKEFKEEKAGTGRLTHLCLPNSVIHMGQGFEGDEAVQALLNDPRNFPVLLYPGMAALNLSEVQVDNPQLKTFNAQLHERRLVVFLLDATWGGARKMFNLSPSLQRLPRIMFTPSAPSRYIIKQQPAEGCLSTLEAVHELLTVLARTGLDEYPRPEQLLGVFQRMQDFQIKCAADPSLAGYRRQPYSSPGQRKKTPGGSWARRLKYLTSPLNPKGGGEA